MKDIVFLIPLVLCACGNNKNQIAVSHNNMTSFDSDTLWIDEPDNTPTCHYDPILRKWFGPGSDEMNGTKYEYYDEDVTGLEIRFGLWGADLTPYFNKESVDSNLKVYHHLIKKYTTLRKRFGVVQFLISIYTLC